MPRIRKLSNENLYEKLRIIDDKIGILTEERKKIASLIQEEKGTAYFSGKPKKTGYYHYSYPVAAAAGGGAIGYWNGKKWEKVKGWGDYSMSSEIVWYGKGRSRKEPLLENEVKAI